jgi:four helix bundle protein
MTIRKFEDVLAWQKGRELNQLLFKTLEDNRNFSFKDQLFRASLSITNNIAEGFERGGDKELRYFLLVSRGSTGEVRSMLYTALDMGYVNQEQFKTYISLVAEVGRLLTGFIKKLNPRLSDYKTIGQ